MITLLEPSGNKYKRYLPLLKKYGIDETEVKRRIDRYKSGLDPILIDSLTLASRRDQEVQRMNTIIMHRNDKKNLNLFLKIFDQYGYPSEEKAGTTGNDGEPLIIITILSHLICLDYNKIYPRLNEFLKKGEILPRTFALIVDKYYLCENKNGYYNVYGKSSNKDSVIINNSRKRIGLPTLTHYAKIRRDYFNSSR
ncbi:hypothetical protein [uncultured Chryseobacterium sp.]|uniref:hypothetical protein n=1 Tax=uncultured Chryseobacterium sp. TaxID=259322 RepID=UPI0025EF0087|nr:hypothetical protein [uncultured Chryseobacterium sp.]